MSGNAIGEGLRKIVAYKKETTPGVAAGAAGGKQIRRVTANFNLKKETYESAEIRSDYQVVDFRHGVRSVEGNVSAEMSPGSYSDFLASSLGRDFTAVTSITGASITIAASGNFYTVTRAAGSYITDGVKPGMVVRLTAGTFNANNLNKNLLVTVVTATVLTVAVLNNLTLTPEGPIAAATIAIPGKVTYVPTASHTDDSYTFEEFYQDIAQSEVSVGNKVNTVGLKLPATGLVTADFSFMGLDQPLTGTTQYFTTPTAQGTSGIFASVNGALLVGGVPVSLITSLDVNINRNLSGDAVVGSNIKPEIFEGRAMVDGSFSTLFQDRTFADIFKDETEVSLLVAVTTTSAKDSDFMVYFMPRIKINSDDKDDGEKGLVSSNSFKALKGFGTGNAEATTIQIQDSLA